MALVMIALGWVVGLGIPAWFMWEIKKAQPGKKDSAPQEQPEQEGNSSLNS